LTYSIASVVQMIFQISTSKRPFAKSIAGVVEADEFDVASGGAAVGKPCRAAPLAAGLLTGAGRVP
jgi:hypothetical protein